MILTLAAVMVVVIEMSAQHIFVVDNMGQGIPLASVTTEDGVLIGTTGLDGKLNDLKGAKTVTIAHVAYNPKQVTIDSRSAEVKVTMEDANYSLSEIVVKPKPYVYVEAFYRVYVYRGDSLCYYLSGIMPNAYDVQKKKLEHGSYYHSYGEFCPKFGASIVWGARAQHFKAGQVATKGIPVKAMEKKYHLTATEQGPNLLILSNPEGTIGQIHRTEGQARLTVDGGKAQMYANKVDGETKKLAQREEMNYEYQFTLIYDDNEEKRYDVTNFVMDCNHWEYNDKKSHVKFIIETYATGHGYMDKEEWKDKKKELKEAYKTAMTLGQLEGYAAAHHIPSLAPTVSSAVGKLVKKKEK